MELIHKGVLITIAAYTAAYLTIDGMTIPRRIRLPAAPVIVPIRPLNITQPGIRPGRAENGDVLVYQNPPSLPQYILYYLPASIPGTYLHQPDTIGLNASQLPDGMQYIIIDYDTWKMEYPAYQAGGFGGIPPRNPATAAPRPHSVNSSGVTIAANFPDNNPPLPANMRGRR